MSKRLSTTDPDALTDRDLMEIDVLAACNDREFEAAVTHYIAQPDPDGAGERVFRSAHLVERTFEALNSAIARQQSALGAPMRGGSAIVDRKNLMAHLTAERRSIGQIINTMSRTAGDSLPRRQAKNVLADVFSDHYLWLVRAIQRGADPDEAGKQLRDQLRGRTRGHP